MFGTVTKTSRNTRFRLEVRLENDCLIYEVIIVPNNELEAFPRMYGFVLDKMTDKLEKRINERHQSWMRQ